MSRMYSLGFFLSSGHSDGRIMYSWSSRCIRNGIQASPTRSRLPAVLGSVRQTVHNPVGAMQNVVE